MFVPDESPPPSYSAVVAGTLAQSLESLETALPFSHSDDLAANILALTSEGQALNSRFKGIRNVVGAEFEHQEAALVLSKRFETLVWESRDIAGSALVALKDFNEIVLDFLSKQGVPVEDRLKELGNVYKLLQREKNSATKQKSSFDSLVKELEDFLRMIYSESDALNVKRRRQNHSGGKGARSTRSSRKPRSPLVILRSKPSRGLSAVTASIGATPRNCMNSTLHAEHVLGKDALPVGLCLTSVPEVQETKAAAPSNLERKRVCPSTEQVESVAVPPSIVEPLVRDLCAFTGHIDVFSTIFAELAREQDIFVVYLKDGLSVGNQRYTNEISRFRRHLPCVCDALDAYSKGRSS